MEIRSSNNKSITHTAEVSDAILTPFSRDATLTLPGSTKSGSEGGKETPSSGVSKEGRELDCSPVNQLNNPAEDGLTAAALEVAYRVAWKLPRQPYSQKKIIMRPSHQKQKERKRPL